MSLFNDTGSYTWTITKKLSNCKIGDKLTSGIFPIALENLKMQMKIYPNGSKEDFEGYAMVFCKVVAMPPNWKMITICKTVNSPQTKSKQTNMGQYKIGVNQGWKYVLPFNEIRDLQNLQLIITIKILRIEMKNTVSIYYPQQFAYEKVINLQYTLNSAEIQHLKHCKMGKMIESTIFSSMWCIRLCPNGCTPRDAGKCALGLTLCGLPKDISKIKAIWSIKCVAMKISASQTSDFSLHSTTKGCNIGTFKTFKQLNELVIDINVEIVKEFDKNNKQIPVSVAVKLSEDEYKMSIINDSDNKSVDDKSVHVQDKLEKYELKMDLLEGKCAEYEANFDKMKHKISKMAELLTKSLKLNKQNDIWIKKLNLKVNKLMDEEKRDIIANNDLKNEIDKLQGAVTQLSINSKNNASNDSHSNDKEILRRFIEKEVKINSEDNFNLYESLLENGFETLESLYDLTMNDLKEIGIRKLYHRKRLLKCIQTKKSKNRASFSMQSQTKQSNSSPGHAMEGSVSFQSYSPQ